MCLLFVYIDNEAEGNDYRLVVANTRDEFFDRPALSADYWTNERFFYGGLDYQPGRQGGTWLALSTKGRIGCLLNILGRQDPIKAGRGHLVPDFLRSDGNSDAYIESIAMGSAQYNLFNFVSLENRGNQWSGKLFTNAEGGSKMNFSNGIYQFGNSVHYEKPWNKGSVGKLLFTDIVNSLSRATGDVKDDNSGGLHEQLMDLLSNNTKNYPDDILDSQSVHMPDGSAEELSSISVNCLPHLRYGTRTKTVITITGRGSCVYEEQTMLEPIPNADIAWKQTLQQFSVDSY